MTRVPLVALIALTLSGCALAPHAGRSTGHTSAPATGPIVEVRNDHLLSVRIFTFWSGSRYFLGEVAPGTVGFFKIPRDAVEGDRIRLMADPMGSVNEYVTDPIELGGAHRIQWHVRSYLRGSRLRVM